MEIQIPSNGCSIYYGTYIDHYQGNVRTRYYLQNEKLVKNSSSSYNSMPSGYSCISQGDLTYKPELKIWFPFLSFALILVCAILLYKIFLKRIMP